MKGADLICGLGQTNLRLASQDRVLSDSEVMAAYALRLHLPQFYMQDSR